MDGTNTLLVIIGVVVIIIFGTAAIAGIKAAPYVPTFQRDVRRMLRLAQAKPDEIVVDLGAGDGRFMLTAVKEFSTNAVGFEISVLPFIIAVIRIRLSKLQNKAKVNFKDFYQQDLSDADIVTCFLTPEAMAKLEPKFNRELKPGARVVSYAFKLPTWSPEEVDKPTPTSTPVFLYKKS